MPRGCSSGTELLSTVHIPLQAEDYRGDTQALWLTPNTRQLHSGGGRVKHATSRGEETLRSANANLLDLLKHNLSFTYCVFVLTLILGAVSVFPPLTEDGV